TLGKQLVAESSRTDFASDLAESEMTLGNELLTVILGVALQVPDGEGGLGTSNLPQPAEKLYREGEELFRDALALNQKIAASNPGEPKFQANVRDSQYSLARLLNKTNRSKEAEDLVREAIKQSQELTAEFGAKPEGRQQVAESYGLLGVLLQESNQLKKAEAAWRTAVDLREKLAGDFTSRPEVRHNLVPSRHYFGA